VVVVRASIEQFRRARRQVKLRESVTVERRESIHVGRAVQGQNCSRLYSP
jgi:hypothetical protein